MDHLTDRLVACRDCLVRFGVRGWPDEMTKLAGSDQSACARAQTVRSWCGGMGSLTDLVIDPANGHQVEQEDTEEANREFMDRLAELLTVADALLRAQARKPG